MKLTTHQPVMDVLAHNLRDRRESLGLTREDLAEISTISVGTISAIERRCSQSTLVTTVARLAHALEVQPGRLLETRQ